MAYAHYSSYSTEWDGGVDARPMTIRATSSVFLPIAGVVAAMAGHVDRCEMRDAHRVSAL
jgi:hypothetical protein